MLAETEYKVNQEVFLNPSYNATSQTYDISTTVNNNRHGVRIIAVILGAATLDVGQQAGYTNLFPGEIGHFEFQTLLITVRS